MNHNHQNGSITTALAAAPLLLLTVSISVPARAADNGCKPVFDAMSKVLVTPTHLYNTETAAFRKNKPTTGEGIYFGGAIYVLVGGKWRRSPMDAAAMAKQEEENRRTSKYSCRYLRDEAVNGEAAAVYASHSENEDTKANATTWISKSRGLPLRTEEDFGDQTSATHMSMRYDYSGVRPPAGVQ
jgi:hypothetical protein